MRPGQGTRDRGGRSRRLPVARTALVAICVSVLLAWVPSWTTSTASAAEDNTALVASIDVDRMMETIEALQSFGSREFHLESSRQAAEYLYQSFEDIGVPVERQYLTVDETQVSNVVATLQGSDEDAGAYLFGAHYDSENSGAYNLQTAENLSAPGADDDASGVAAVLEMARVLSGSGFPATVKFVMFDAEEYGYDNSGGCKGSEYFVAQEVALGHAYEGTAILDMIGYRAGVVNSAVMVVNEDGYALAESTRDAVEAFGIDLTLDVLNEPSITYSDHSSFWQGGMPSMLVIEELGDRYSPLNPNYHTSYDNASSLCPDQLEAVTKALLGGLLTVSDDGADRLIIFGIAIMSAVAILVALFIYMRRMTGRV